MPRASGHCATANSASVVSYKSYSHIDYIIIQKAAEVADLAPGDPCLLGVDTCKAYLSTDKTMPIMKEPPTHDSRNDQMMNPSLNSPFRAMIDEL